MYGATIVEPAYEQWARRAPSAQQPIGGSASVTTVERRPSFSETYTALSALFAGLAFAAVAWNLITQGRQVRQDRTKEQFLNLLNTWQSATRDIGYNGAHGIAGWLKAENELLGAYNGDAGTFDVPGQFFGQQRAGRRGALGVSEVVETFRSFYEKKIGTLAYLLRVQHQILRILDSGPAGETLRNQLVEVYRAMLSDPELHLLLYFGLSSYAPKGYSSLISKYRILDSLLHKQERFIADRIPEIEHYARYRKWRKLRRQLD